MNMTLREEISQAQKQNVAIGHFNVSDEIAFRAIVSAAKKLNVPVIIGVSEGERNFIGVKKIADMVRTARETEDVRVFLNADHTHSFENIVAAVEAGFDAVLFDAGKETLEKNIEETKRVVAYVQEYNRTHNTDVLVEGELGYIGSSSVVFENIPEGAAISPQQLTTVTDATRFVEETGVDLIAPAVGNIHGMFHNAPNPAIDTVRIHDIVSATHIPMVLHGGSGIVDEQFLMAIDSGVSVIHINTELRVAWREGFENVFRVQPQEIVPYKMIPDVITSIENVVLRRLSLFNKIK